MTKLLFSGLPLQFRVPRERPRRQRLWPRAGVGRHRRLRPVLSPPPRRSHPNSDLHGRPHSRLQGHRHLRGYCHLPTEPTPTQTQNRTSGPPRAPKSGPVPAFANAGLCRRFCSGSAHSGADSGSPGETGATSGSGQAEESQEEVQVSGPDRQNHP